MLRVLEPVHSERLELLRALQVALTNVRELAAVLCEDGGYPALSVSRLDGGGSMRVGCIYHKADRDWWYVTPDHGARWLSPSYDIRSAAASIRRMLHGTGGGR